MGNITKYYQFIYKKTIYKNDNIYFFFIQHVIYFFNFFNIHYSIQGFT